MDGWTETLIAEYLYMEDGRLVVIEHTTLPDVLRNEDGSPVDG